MSIVQSSFCGLRQYRILQKQTRNFNLIHHSILQPLLQDPSETSNSKVVSHRRFFRFISTFYLCTFRYTKNEKKNIFHAVSRLRQRRTVENQKANCTKCYSLNHHCMQNWLISRPRNSRLNPFKQSRLNLVEKLILL